MILLIILSFFGVLLIGSVVAMTCIVLASDADDYYESNFKSIEELKAEEEEHEQNRC